MKNKVQDVINNGYEFNMGSYMDGGWNVFKKGAGPFIGYTVITLIISMALSQISQELAISFGGDIGVLLGVNFSVSIISQFLQYVLYAGYIIYAARLVADKADFPQFFEGFKFIKEILLFRITYSLILLPMVILLFIYIVPLDLYTEILRGQFDPTNIQDLIQDWTSTMLDKMNLIVGLGSVIAIISIYLAISYSLVLPLIVLGNLPFWNAMEASRKIMGKKFFHFLMMYILLIIIMSIGTLLTCGLGILVVIPYMYCIMFTMYKNIIGLDEEEDNASYDALVTE